MKDSHKKFEDELESELRKHEAAERRKWHLSWLGTPLFLWFLTFVVVGVIGFTYRSYNLCTEKNIADNELLNRIAKETSYRADQITATVRDAGQGGFDTDEVLSAAKTVTDPTKTFYFKEFEGISARDLLQKVADVGQRWGILSVMEQDYLRLRENVPLSFLPDYTRLSTALVIIDVINEKTAPLSPRVGPFGGAVPPPNVRAESILAKMKELEGIPFGLDVTRIPLIACIKRSVWPF